ncbi:MAG: S-layer homology domain-containing protein, partial [Clostridia bacterium]|nr:S-layer homology domain-containing protein [Clostridia bacterium]
VGLGEGLTFRDTPKTEWYADYVGWALREGIVAGYPDNTFKPDAPVTRSELAVVLARFFNYRDIYLAEAPLIASFADAGKIEDWAADAVEKIRLCGIISGDPAGKFNPASSATRAEIATMITRYLDAARIAKVDYIMDHVYDLLPMDGRFATLDFSRQKEIIGPVFSEKLIAALGLDPSRYEALSDEEELSELAGIWPNYGYGDRIYAQLTVSLRDNATGETSSPVTVKFMLHKIKVTVYTDPDAFDPGLDEELYSQIISSSGEIRGDTGRLRKAFEKGLSGETVTVAYIGGSITEGANGGEDACYARISANWFERHVTDKLNYVNAGISGSDSTLGCARFTRDVISKDPDIVFIEFAANDWPSDLNRESLESMIRTALKSKNEPAVVLVISYGATETIPFITQAARYYDLPIVDAARGIAYAIENGAFTDEEFRPDGTHPEVYGHEIMSDMIEELFRSVMKEIEDGGETAVSPVPENGITEARFEGMRFIEGQDLDAVSFGSFKFPGKDLGWGFIRPAISSAKKDPEPLVFRIEAKTVELVIEHGTFVEVTVDGSDPYVLGCSSYFADAKPIVISGETAVHTVTVKQAVEGTNAVLVGIAYN